MAKHKQDNNVCSVPKKLRRLDPGVCAENHVPEMISLFDFSAMTVAAKIPYEYVENTLVNIPDPVQERILYFSFPRDSGDIKKYSSFMPYKCNSNDKTPYAVGEQLFLRKGVEDVIQIGFHLTGVVKPENIVHGLLDKNVFKVSMTFDRCKITSVSCTCNCRGLSWCSHAVALALFRINTPDLVNYRAPISDTLIKMDRNQLQRFAQYLIASHSNRVLASAQHLADNLLQRDSQMNKIHGAPDPTAGGCVDDASIWYLDEVGVREQLRLDLAAVAAVSATSTSSNSTASSMIAVDLHSQTPVAGNSHNRLHQFGLFSNGISTFSNAGGSAYEIPRSRMNTRHASRHSTGDGNEEVARHRSPGPRPFYQMWLDNYRNLQRSRMPPFGYSSLLSSVNPSSINITTNQGQFPAASPGVAPAVHQAPASTTNFNSLSPLYSTISSGQTDKSFNPGSHVAIVFAKIYELLASRDTNGPRLLAIITEELLNLPNLLVPQSRRSYRPVLTPAIDGGDDNDPLNDTEVARVTQRAPPSWAIPLWDEIARLWACLLLSPDMPPSNQAEWRDRLTVWSNAPNAPRGDIYFVPSLTNPPAVENLTSVAVSSPPLLRPPSRAPVGRGPTSVFQLAIDVSQLKMKKDYVDKFVGPIPPNAMTELARSLPANVTQCTCPFCGVSLIVGRSCGANETFTTVCLRVSALQTMGFSGVATKLATALAYALLDCLDEIKRNSMDGNSHEQISPPPPPPSFLRSQSVGVGSNRPSSHFASLTVNTSNGGTVRGSVVFKSPPLPSPYQAYPQTQHQRYLPHPHQYPTWPPVSPTPPVGRLYPFPHQLRQNRFSNWQRTPPPQTQLPTPNLQECVYASESSVDCPFHEHGWLGLPGRPIISLVECLLDAAANKVQEAAIRGHSAYFPNEYLYLALKVGIVALCQQRSLPPSSSALISQQTQEMRLIHLLNTIPRNDVTVKLVGLIVSQLMGPTPLTDTPHSWWWSALAPVVHPNTYPIHVVTEFLFGFLLAGETYGVSTGELAYLVAARSMRFPVLESVSDSPLSPFNVQPNQTTPHQQNDAAVLRQPSPCGASYRLPPLPSVFASVTVLPGVPANPCTTLMHPRLLQYRFGQEQLPQMPPPPGNTNGDPHTTTNQAGAAAANRRDLGAMEGRQIRLAISLILASRSAVYRIDHFMRVCDRHIHASMSLLSISKEVLAEAVGNRSGLDQSFCALSSSSSTTSSSSSFNYTTTFNFDETTLPLSFATTHSSPSCNLGYSNILPVHFITTLLPTNAIQERIVLVCAAFHLALCVTMRTAWPRVHWRRREILGWTVSTGLLAGPHALLHLAQSWSVYASPREAVTWVAPTLLACLPCIAPGQAASGPAVGNIRVCGGGIAGGGVGGARVARLGQEVIVNSPIPRVYSFLPFSVAVVEQIKSMVRQMIIQAAAQDPVNCALIALQLTELDAASFEATYRLVLDAAKSGMLGPTHLFSAARHLDCRGYPLWAFPLAEHAMRFFSFSGLQENHPVAHDVLWSCLLAHRIGPTTLQQILAHVIKNVECPTLLADILHRCRAPPQVTASQHQSSHRHRTSFLLDLDYGYARCPVGNYASFYPGSKQPQVLLPVDAPPLKDLLEATISAFVTTTHARLANISPRQYSEFLEFLTRARDTFGLLKPDGPNQFHQLVICLCQSYKGKRKLVALLHERFLV